MFWVVLTCALRCLTQWKRNFLNQIIWGWENVPKLVWFGCFSNNPIYTNISTCFGHFLSRGWSDWADSFRIVSGISRHKFRLQHINRIVKKSGLLWVDPLCGTPKNICLWEREKLLLNTSCYIIHHIRYSKYWVQVFKINCIDNSFMLLHNDQIVASMNVIYRMQHILKVRGWCWWTWESVKYQCILKGRSNMILIAQFSKNDIQPSCQRSITKIHDAIDEVVVKFKFIETILQYQEYCILC